MNEEVVLITMSKDLDEPFYIQRDGKDICVYIDIETDYRVVLSEDIETGHIEADSITEEGVKYYITSLCDDDSGVEYPIEFDKDKIEKNLTKEERELLQAFAEKNSGFIDEDVVNEALKKIQ